ncbi:CoA ester lyase [Corynebacterium sp. TAE3-ERU12]|uniref:HpcH/HpaI aldolase/citrate lyase family protein n=1 Tax=Corynebacterium sp. TAE3-ERU12 TaxID=2849491 RepID=UPI001C44530A|nr:CoA ester lyase [Corynebacterium sp. TAE3-ERU12]MBV7294798.1 CoA ester lyase [Corynebacterium sp. TAE3-ERU12]
MTSHTWFPAGPALLFAPADRPERFGKAAQRADVVILDLEDGCRPENRTQARANIAATDLDPERTIVRINPADSPDHAEDLAALKKTPFRTVMLPKAESASQIAALHGFDVIALCETPRGVLNALDIASADNLVAMFWGAEDLTAALGGTHSRDSTGTYRDVARYARAHVHLAAAAQGVSALDSVHVDIADVDGLRAEADDAAALGYVGTCCIHPSQVAIIRQAYRPTDEQIEWATGLLEAAKDNSGAFSFAGQMVDAPLVSQAEAILRRAV